MFRSPYSGGRILTRADEGGYPSLLENLSEFWEMNEEGSGSRVGSHANLTLIDGNSNLSHESGIVGNAVKMEYSAGLLKTTIVPTELQVGDFDWSYAYWIYPEGGDGSGTYYIHAIGVETSGAYWAILQSIRYGKYRLSVAGSDGDTSLLSANVMAINQWHFIVAMFDASEDKIFIKIDNNIIEEGPCTITPGHYQYRYFLGARPTSNGSPMYAGRIDSFGYWKKLLTESEIAYLYNSGAGRTYTDF